MHSRQAPACVISLCGRPVTKGSVVGEGEGEGEGERETHHPSEAIQRTNAVRPASTSPLIQSLKLSGVSVLVCSGRISCAAPARQRQGEPLAMTPESPNFGSAFCLCLFPSLSPPSLSLPPLSPPPSLHLCVELWTHPVRAVPRWRAASSPSSSLPSLSQQQQAAPPRRAFGAPDSRRYNRSMREMTGELDLVSFGAAIHWSATAEREERHDAAGAQVPTGCNAASRSNKKRETETETERGRQSAARRETHGIKHCRTQDRTEGESGRQRENPGRRALLLRTMPALLPAL